MISKKDIIKMARTVSKRSQGYRPHRMMHPNRDWLIGIALLIVVVLVGGFINAQEYMAYNALEDETEGAALSIKKYRYSLAKDVRTMYEERSQKFGSLAEERSSVVFVHESLSEATTTIVSSTEVLNVTEEMSAVIASTSDEVSEVDSENVDVVE